MNITNLLLAVVCSPNHVHACNHLLPLLLHLLPDEELMATAEQLGSQSVAAAAPSKGRGGGGGGGGGSGKNRRKG